MRRLAAFTALAAIIASAGFVQARAAAASATLALNSPLVFILDAPLDSGADRPGTLIPAHLRTALVVGGRTLAPAGTRIEIRVNGAVAAQSMNVPGALDITFEPLPLIGGNALPLTTPVERLDPHESAGRATTQGITDTLGDILIPGHVLYRIFRKGPNVRIPAGTPIRAATAATLSVRDGAVAIATPEPLITDFSTPAPAFSPEPMATPWEAQPVAPKSTPTPTPTPTPSAAPAPSATVTP